MNEVFTPIPQAIEAIRKGEIIILIDDEDRENEGDFVFAAEHATPEKINLLATHGRGLICVPAARERLAHFLLEPYPENQNTALMGTNFTVSVDARHGVTTGISAPDRCRTVRVLADPRSRPSDLVRPGHIHPIAAKDGGVLTRAGHTEATVDLCRLAGLEPVGVLCEILKDDGEMARLPDLIQIARRFSMPIVTIRDLIGYRQRTEKLVKRAVTTRIPNAYGEWELTLYEDLVNDELHLAMTMGEINDEPLLVRMHSQCFTGDTLGSLRCECGPQLFTAMDAISRFGRGVIVYLHQEGRGIGLKNKLLAYALQDQGLDTIEANEKLGFKADLREYGIGAQILVDLGVRRIRLMTNNPRKIVGLEAFNLEIVERVPLEVGHCEFNQHYLETKRRRLGHMLSGAAVLGAAPADATDDGDSATKQVS
ncbi:MAG TPA: bifunctional 3,4-dihydroxy-2-butanone-4-phosphate synthase/GTP cyclohydrolase II [Candidatus Sumerlaeota bacterium]|nr:bifunctional 3,4-dihydroxy-2-butanone-4-phosphate synthase/GTP cyclohydrolase II [Candidatus Sumerlaeota bacterium]